MTATSDRSADNDPGAAPVRPARVALVSGDEITTRGLASILRQHREWFEFVTISSRDSAPIDLALYDPAMGGASSSDRLARLLADPRVRRVAIFTLDFDPSQAPRFMDQGVCAYLSKRMTGAEIVEALDRAASGALVFPGDASLAAGGSAPYGDELTAREVEVLRCIASGFSNVEIATTLNVSINSIKSYIKSCYRKIEVDTRSKAVLWALTHGLGGVEAHSGDTPAGESGPGESAGPGWEA